MEPGSYRRRKRSDTWHFMPSCSNWPVKDFVVRGKKSTHGELCDQCLAKARRAARS